MCALHALGILLFLSCIFGSHAFAKKILSVKQRPLSREAAEQLLGLLRQLPL